MAKGSATEDTLAGLHKTIARVLDKQLGETLVVNPEAVEAGEEEAEVMYTASPALLTMAARFLKDNDITVDTGAQDEGQTRIQKRLDELKNNRGKVISLADIKPVAADG